MFIFFLNDVFRFGYTASSVSELHALFPTLNYQKLMENAIKLSWHFGKSGWVKIASLDFRPERRCMEVACTEKEHLLPLLSGRKLLGHEAILCLAIAYVTV